MFMSPNSSNLNVIEKYLSMLKRNVTKQLSVMDFEKLKDLDTRLFVKGVLAELDQQVDASIIARSNFKFINRV